jgi:ADP-ribosylglycohydrolase
MALAVAQAALTHADPAAGWGAAIGVALVRAAINGEDPLASLPDVVRSTPPAQHDLFAEILAAGRHPADAALPNGSVWGCLSQAVWAFRTTDSFEAAVIDAIDIGGDTDTVACVTGALAGAAYGIEGIPERWAHQVHGRLTTPEGDAEYDLAALRGLALRLLE